MVPSLWLHGLTQLKGALVAIAPQTGREWLETSRSFFSVDQPNVILDTIKPAEQGNRLIVRMYEAHGTRCRVTFRTSLPVRDMRWVDPLERPVEDDTALENPLTFEMAPFEIVTLSIQRD